MEEVTNEKPHEQLRDPFLRVNQTKNSFDLLPNLHE
jgi:hypothetical protein